MTLFDQLADPARWERFYRYKAEHFATKDELKGLRSYIDEAAYLPVLDGVRQGVRFALPKKSVISKMSTGKKRTVYTYPPAENLFLKHLTYLLLRKYNALFSPCLYSFRPGVGAKEAVRTLRQQAGSGAFGYKTDVRDYFNSIPTEKLLPMLKAAIPDDPPLLGFLSALLLEPEALDRGKPVTEQKGIMAGTPVSCFFANLYLSDIDAYFHNAGVRYARYSDDIILFADTAEEAAAHAETLKARLLSLGLTVNPGKEAFFTPEEGWVFLGFSCKNGVLDVSPVSVQKIKAKMRRKTRALQRWAKRKGAPGEKAALAFVRAFNRKLYENPTHRDLTWARWFFPAIETAESLGEIDRYAEDCIRVLASGKRTKARYNVRYADIKALGFRSLVHEYYQSEKTTEVPGNGETEHEKSES